MSGAESWVQIGQGRPSTDRLCWKPGIHQGPAFILRKRTNGSRNNRIVLDVARGHKDTPERHQPLKVLSTRPVTLWWQSHVLEHPARMIQGWEADVGNTWWTFLIGPFVQRFSILDCLSWGEGSTPSWTANSFHCFLKPVNPANLEVARLDEELVLKTSSTWWAC